ncbi:MAG: sulfatase-like hydrolase/transferase [Spirochaetota bacterium]|nr:sulfatase-like hydrolase/transferase [Spirochaetota bacterium]
MKRINKIKEFLRPWRNMFITVICICIIIYILKNWSRTAYLYYSLKEVIAVSISIWIIFYLIKKIDRLKFLYHSLKYFIITLLSIGLIVLVFLLCWYNYCFFPNDQEYLRNKAASVEYTNDSHEEVEIDLIRSLKDAEISNPLTRKDRDFLLKSELRRDDFYIDTNPYYNKSISNNLKYSTGRIFYYTYQKNSIVLKGDSRIVYALGKTRGKARFIEFDAVFPTLADSYTGDGILRLFFADRKRKRLLLEKKIMRERKPDILPFRYSNPISSIFFYLRHRGRSVLTDYVGWERIKQEIPGSEGKLEIEITVEGGDRNYLFLGSPRILTLCEKKRDDHLNIVYLIFDTLSKYHIDLYEYYDVFEKNNLDEAFIKLGPRRVVTPIIDRYTDNICIFDRMYSTGQVTRPSIVSLWTSQLYTKSRLPVFRNIVTDKNKSEFHDMGFASLADELSKHGYFTKQISCNAQGHGVSGVGVDLGFDENYDYTMETTELTENFRRIIEFLNENQNRKFFLYSHINVPHTPRWIPLRYFIPAYFQCNFIINSATILGNLRYMNDCLGHIMDAFERLHLDKNTIVVITSDHSMGRCLYYRGEGENRDWFSIFERESQLVASSYNHSIYIRKGDINLYDDVVNIPWIIIAPSNLNVVPGRVTSTISALDISPTLLDLALARECEKFSGKSFKRMLFSKDKDKTKRSIASFVGRFQRGFVYNGRYKYWRNLLGLYKYRSTEDKKKLIMHQEYLYDLQYDPYETHNLSLSSHNNVLLDKMRELYLQNYVDYPDKNFIQISPSPDGIENLYTVKAQTQSGVIIYPEVYDEYVTFTTQWSKQIVFNARVSSKSAYMSFETDPSDTPLTITIYKNGKLLPRSGIFSSIECVNIFNNPIQLSGDIDFHIAREPGKTGLERKDIPEASIYYSRIPLNYWMEMSRSDKDINLSPGIKEVLRGWGYIQ